MDAEFVATFCYSHEFEPMDGESAEDWGDTIGGAFVKDPACEQQPFVRGGAVELHAE